MTAAEARNQSLWNSLPFNIKNRIVNAVNDVTTYSWAYKVELYKSITPDIFTKSLTDNILKLEKLGYGVEVIERIDCEDDIDSKLIISW